MNKKEDLAKNAYWRSNIRLILVCLAGWFLVSLGAGVLFVETLNQYSIFGYPLGFWFAQQGSIFGFVLLICFYNWRVRKLDQEFTRRMESQGDRIDEPR